MIDYLGTLADIPAPERELADALSELLDARLRPRLGDLYESAEFPLDMIPELAALGLFGAHVPGMATASALAWGMALREVERIDSGLRSLVSVQACLTMTAIARWGSVEQREHWLPRLQRGDVIGAFSLTEPDHGSDPSGLSTLAERTADGWTLRGHKRWASNAPIAGVVIVWAQTEPAAGSRGIRGFVVPLPWPGVEVRPIDRKLSLRMSPSGEIILRDVRLPFGAILPEARGLGAALACLNEARYSIAWGVVGVAEECLEIAVARVKSRQQFGRPLGGFQLVQARLAAMLDDVTRAQLVARRLADLKDTGVLRHQQVSFAKRHNVAAAQRVASAARALLGAEGILVDSAVMRHMANLESVATYEGTDEIHTLVIGADLTGIDAFR